MFSILLGMYSYALVHDHPAQFKAYGRYELIDCKLKATLVSKKDSLFYIRE